MKNKLTELKTWFENLDENSLKRISEFYGNDCFFKDPFNEIKGVSKIENIFTHMFTNLEKPRFEFIDTIDGDDSSFLTWDFIFLIKNKEYKIHGSSHIKWSNDKVIYHRDYWDVGEELFLKIPVLKSLYSFFAKRFASV